jgi:hypothetical protein
VIGLLGKLVLAAALGALSLVQAEVAEAVPIYGIDVPVGVPPLPPPSGEEVERGPCTTFLDFDEAAQPSLFKDANPLRTEYQGLGVVFSSPNDLDGGALLDEVANFGVSGHSSPNFLAFNCLASMQNGGVPRVPEFLSFALAVSSVSALVGSRDPVMLTMEAYDVNAQLIDSDTVLLSPAMQLISVEASGIVSVVLGGQTPCIFVLDDLCLGSDATPVADATWGAVKTLFK